MFFGTAVGVAEGVGAGVGVGVGEAVADPVTSTEHETPIPFEVVPVTVVLPGETPVTLIYPPMSFTVATEASPEVQVMLSVAPVGVM